ncbi:ABC transporter ATP-binding protein [Nocardia sp. CS682]|uniref:ABC transporter ATP-binding protein n=1 Tax=Nocardia sp. CS682 TaxID=1047172 RepID=UPI001074A0C0|nr:ABC transporter ATP-binding protein [Nocardia sp. CS682]QBS41298.1 hypothetical protein DMB37_15385 [Nocardia sp. CS682]
MSLSIRGASKRYPATRAAAEARTVLDGVDLSVSRGEFVTVMGKSGSGKSTLLHCAAGLLPLSSGEISLNSHNISKSSSRAMSRLYRTDIGFIFQSSNLIRGLTGYGNVEFALRCAGRKVSRAEIRSFFCEMDIEVCLDLYPDEMSGGQMQRVAVARALLKRPGIVFADEPTGSLDATNGEFVVKQLRALADLGSSVLVVTHSDAVARESDTVYVMEQGKLGKGR